MLQCIQKLCITIRLLILWSYVLFSAHSNFISRLELLNLEAITLILKEHGKMQLWEEFLQFILCLSESFLVIIDPWVIKWS